MAEHSSSQGRQPRVVVLPSEPASSMLQELLDNNPYTTIDVDAGVFFYLQVRP